jgi:hypothetical protein
MTTAAKRARKKANRKAKLERLALIMEKIDALADLPEEELAKVTVRRSRPESEKAAATQALAATKRLRKRTAKDD